MTFEFRSEDQDKEHLPTLAIVVDGRKCGYVQQCRRSLGYGVECHAVLEIEGGAGVGEGPRTGLAQGFGTSPTEAVLNAFMNGHNIAQRYLQGLAKLQARYCESAAL
ncbi:MAG: hypothetical protein FWD62_01655 [Betaproteobacteria bacterium]|nr:hypothetical protein [Betaproteobacteria bacterium]